MSIRAMSIADLGALGDLVDPEPNGFIANGDIALRSWMLDGSLGRGMVRASRRRSEILKHTN